jgi:hypothetical protein
LPTGSDDGGSNFNDGRVGTAYIQELRFNKYCERLQSLLNSNFDTEFKLYLNNKGVNIDPNIFAVKFQTPQNFASYRQTEMDSARISTFSSLVEVPFISKRFALKRFLGLSAEEMAENEELWKEENIDDKEELSSSQELRGAGITAGGITGDMDSLGGSDTGEEGMDPSELSPEGDMGAGGGVPGGAPAGAQPGSPV